MAIFRLSVNRQICYEVSAGPSPDAPVIVLANPLAANLHIWDEVVKVLTYGGYRVLRFDHPGHDLSTIREGSECTTTFPSMAADINRLLTHLAGPTCPPDDSITLPVAAWIGVSMGAALGVFLTTAFPNLASRLILVDTISCSPVHSAALDVFTPRVAAAREDGNMERTNDETLNRWFDNRITAKQREAMKKYMSTITLDGFEACCAALVHVSFDLRPLTPLVASSGVTGVLVVVGGEDADLPETMLELKRSIEGGYKAKGIPGEVHYSVVPSAGHIPFVDNFHGFMKIVADFLKVKDGWENLQ